MSEENKQNTYIHLPGAKQDSFTLGTAGKTGAVKFYFDHNDDFEKLNKEFEKMYKIIGELKTKGYCQ